MADDLRRLQHAADFGDDGVLHHSRGEPRRRRLFAGLPVADHIHGDVVAVALAPFFVLVGVMAAPVSLKIRPFSRAGVLGSAVVARLRGLSCRMA